MDDAQKRIYDSVMRYAKDNDIVIYKGRELTEREKQEIEQRHKEISNFLARLEKFEEESRKTRILVSYAA